MYFMLECISRSPAQRISIDYDPDVVWRDWTVGKRFKVPPPLPVVAETTDEQPGELMDLLVAPLPLMSHRLIAAIKGAGVDNIDYYDAEIHDDAMNTIHHTHMAFNLIGAISAADLEKSIFSAEGGAIISVDFNSLRIDESKARDALMFRLAESVNGIVVHESVKFYIEKSGINTLTFTPPEKWIG